MQAALVGVERRGIYSQYGRKDLWEMFYTRNLFIVIKHERYMCFVEEGQRWKNTKPNTNSWYFAIAALKKFNPKQAASFRWKLAQFSSTREEGGGGGAAIALTLLHKVRLVTLATPSSETNELWTAAPEHPAADL